MNMHDKGYTGAIAMTAAILLVGCTAMRQGSPLPPAAESAEAVSPLAVGATVPDVILTGTDGQPVALREQLDTPVVLVFYRGGWCPYCNLQLAGLQEIEDDLQALGVRILAVSPDLPENLLSTVAKESLAYTLLSDSAMKAARAFGIAFRVDDATIEKYKGYNIDLEAASGQSHHLLPVPAVFIIGTDGVISFVYANADYKVRLAPEKLLAAAKRVQGAKVKTSKSGFVP